MANPALRLWAVIGAGQKVIFHQGLEPALCGAMPWLGELMQPDCSYETANQGERLQLLSF